MQVVKVNELPFMQTAWGVKGRSVVNMPEVGIVNLVLEPGEKIPAHATPVDVLFQVVEGTGTVTIGDETQVVESGSIVVSPARVPHALEANQGCAFSVYVMKVPNPKVSAVRD